MRKITYGESSDLQHLPNITQVYDWEYETHFVQRKNEEMQFLVRILEERRPAYPSIHKATIYFVNL
jgi:hypothetical protein